MTKASSRLILVYNADGGWLNALKDMVHKIVSPTTYQCSLCALTYGWVAMRMRWRRFLASLPHEKVFHHRDDFARAFPDLMIALPAILLAEGNRPARLLVSATELDAMADLGALITMIEERLALARMGVAQIPLTAD